VRLLILTIAGMILAGTALAEPLTSPNRSEVTALFTKRCVAMITRDSPKVPRYYSRAPFTDQEISDYCGCVALTMADVLTEEEWSVIKNNKPVKSAPKIIKDSTEEKAKCLAVEKCKKHLNLPDPSHFQYEQCWKG
jgi:hypothetical protein